MNNFKNDLNIYNLFIIKSYCRTIVVLLILIDKNQQFQITKNLKILNKKNFEI